MSYSKCFICGQQNFSGNETRITVERKSVDKETLTHRTVVWEGHLCDGCMFRCFPMLKEEVGE